MAVNAIFEPFLIIHMCLIPWEAATAVSPKTKPKTNETK
nr:MAG TPA: hypothetical protein [Caudoviricetes sp.]